MAIAAIETRYAGCRFRSRLEARWAVFFDRLSINWEYEPQGYRVGYADVRPYLPDFWLPDLRLWVEVKGAEDNLDRSMLMAAMDWGSGLPYMQDSADVHGGPGLLLLGPVPRTRGHDIPVHNQLVHHKGVYHRYVAFNNDGIIALGSNTPWRYDCPMDDSSGKCPHESLLATDMIVRPEQKFDAQKVISAYAAARSARFEHSEHG